MNRLFNGLKALDALKWIRTERPTSSPTNALDNRSADKSRKGRYSDKLRKRHPIRVELGQDKLLEAIERAEDPYFPDRTGLYDLYKETIRDAHIRREIRTARISITGEPFGMFHKKTGEMDKDRLRMLQRPWVFKYIKYILEAEWWGHSLVEFQQMEDSDLGTPEFRDVKLFPRLHVNPVKGEINIHVGATSGIPYRNDPLVGKWLLESDDSEDLGLLEVATREYIWKRFSRTDWATRSERYGMPMLSILTDEQDEQELLAKKEMGENMGSNGVFVGDKEDVLEYLESKQSGGHDIYEKLCRYCDEQNSKLMNGVVIGENSQGGSRSKEEVGERILDKYTEDRLRQMQTHINTKLIPFLIGHGYPLEDWEFKYHELARIDERRSRERKDEDKESPAEALANLYGGDCGCPKDGE